MAPYIIFYKKIHHHWLCRIWNADEHLMWVVFFLFIYPDLRFYCLIFLIVGFPYLLFLTLSLTSKEYPITKDLYLHYVQLSPDRKSCEFVFYRYKKHYRVTFDIKTIKIYIYAHNSGRWAVSEWYKGKLIVEDKATNTLLGFASLAGYHCEYIISRIYNRPFNETTDTIVTVNDNERMYFRSTFNEAESEII